MGLSESTIRFDFEKALRQAAELDEIASQIASSKKKFSSQMQTVFVNWKGENASCFLRKADTFKEGFTKQEKDLRTIAEEIRRIATLVYNTEMENLRIAQSRDY